MNVDQAIAHNVKRIRQDRGLSVAQLAKRLHVGRHLVYDYERPRPGAQQRQFLWSDLVKLCSALQVTLFELVLPPAGVELDTGSTARDWVQELSPIAGEVTGKDARSRLGWMLFGVDGSHLDSDALATFALLRKRDHDEMAEGINRVLDEFVERVRRGLGKGNS
jgi:transcriptional regulator with XRE-family HTH domain